MKKKFRNRVSTHWIFAPNFDSGFEKYQIDQYNNSRRYIVFCRKRACKRLWLFGKMITTLKQRKWFMEYVIKWIWYNSDDGEDENDFATEDVLKHYTNRSSEA